MLPVGYLTAFPPHICNMQAFRDSAGNSACHGRNHKTERAPTTELNIFLSKSFFNRKENKNLRSIGIPKVTSQSVSTSIGLQCLQRLFFTN